MTFKSGAAMSGAVLSPRATCKSRFVKCRQARWLLKSVALSRICFSTDFIPEGLQQHSNVDGAFPMGESCFSTTNNLQRRTVYCFPRGGWCESYESANGKIGAGSTG